MLMKKEKLLIVILMTIVSFCMAYFGWIIFDVFGASSIGVAMGFLFPTLVLYLLSKFFPNSE